MAKQRRKRKYEIRDIREYNGDLPLDYIQRRLNAAHELRKTVKRFLDWWEWYDPYDSSGIERADEMKEALEAYHNA